jgi:hypothetical protein
MRYAITGGAGFLASPAGVSSRPAEPVSVAA